MRKLKWIVLLAAFAVSGCGLLYRIDVQQGNLVTPELVSQLKIGMAEGKVRYIMGNPMLKSVFHQQPNRERWDYYYSLREGWGGTERKHVKLFLENGVLVEAEGDLPASLERETAPAAPAPRGPVL